MDNGLVLWHRNIILPRKISLFSKPLIAKIDGFIGSGNVIVLVTNRSASPLWGTTNPVKSCSLTRNCTRRSWTVKQQVTKLGMHGVGALVGADMVGALEGVVVGEDTVGDAVGKEKDGEAVG